MCVVESTSADMYRLCLRRLDTRIGQLMERCGRRQRLVATDGVGATQQAERSIRLADGAPACVYVACDIHKIDSMANRVAALVPDEVVGMVGIAISHGHGGAMKSLRRVLRKYIGEKLVVLQGYPAPMATAHR